MKKTVKLRKEQESELELGSNGRKH